MFTLSGLINLTNVGIVTAPIVTEKRGNIEKTIFYIKEGKCTCEPIKSMEIISELDRYLTNVARVKTYWSWPILFINRSHDVTVTWYTLIIPEYLGHI